MVFEVGIGTSQDWDPEKASEEVITQALDKLSNPPTFVLLFSTIHYEKNKGFQKILDKIYTKIPKETPLIGGTVAGFINNQNSYTKGITAACFFSDELTISSGVGKRSKANPIKAIKSALAKIELENKNNEFVISIISGGKIPYIPIFKQGRVIKSEIIGKLACFLLPYFGYLNKGVGKEDDIVKQIISTYDNIKLFSISTMDDEKMEKNYQFYFNKIISDSIILLKIKSDFNILINTEHDLNEIKREIKITKISKDKQIIYEINNKSAKKEFLSIMDWPKEYLTEKIYDKVFFYPFAFEKNNFFYPFIPGLFLGNAIVATYKIESDKLSIMNSSGKNLISSVANSMEKLRSPKFILMSECGLRLQTLGRNTFREQQIIQKKFKDIPFISLYVGGEATYTKENGLKYGNSTFNLAGFEK